jgi:hypothetical protein
MVTNRYFQIFVLPDTNLQLKNSKRQRRKMESKILVITVSLLTYTKSFSIETMTYKARMVATNTASSTSVHKLVNSTHHLFWLAIFQ